MGKAHSGRRPDWQRRRQAIALRGQGLTLAEIGGQLHISKQGVSYLLRVAKDRDGRLCPVRCGRCGAAIGRADQRAGLRRPVLCLVCVGDCPGATFGQRLRAHRMAAGLKQGLVARRACIAEKTLIRYEYDRATPPRRILGRLVLVLGPSLAAPAAPINPSPRGPAR